MPAPLGDGFLNRPAPLVARDLLGARIRGESAEGVCEVVVVEVEAYLGRDDGASHAATRTGITDRNRPMFGPAGHWYVYRSYGMHWCLNVVTGLPGDGEAVLIRGVEPILGHDLMTHRRRGRVPLGAGPGRVGQALGIDGGLTGRPVDAKPLTLYTGWYVPDARVRVTGRVGISTAKSWPLRFLVEGSPGVSHGRALPGDAGEMPAHLRELLPRVGGSGVAHQPGRP